MVRSFLGPLAIFAALGGCSGSIPGGGADVDDDQGDDSSDDESDGPDDSNDDGPGDDEGPAVNAPSLCERSPGLLAGPTGLTRLSNVEYRNTIRDLFPKVTIDVARLTLPAEIETGGYLNTASTQSPSAELTEALQTNAAEVAKLAATDLAKVLPCTPANAAAEPACGKQFIAAFGKRAFRRPLSTDEQMKYESFFTTSYGKWGFQTAVRMIIEGFLQSPKMLFRVEGGGDVVSGSKAIPLDDYELATRLAYFLTDTMPDDALLAAAEGGKLASPEGVEKEARRLLQTANARSAVASFSEQWLRFDKMKNDVKAPDLYPGFTPAIAASLRTAMARYVDHFVWEDKHDLPTLLTDNRVYVDNASAPLYGLPKPAGGTLSLVAADPAQRSGLLTQAGLLAGFAHERNDAPVLRGLFVLDRLLCMPVAAPPPTVNTTLPPIPAGMQLTTRQQLEISHAAPECAACHKSIDGIGFGFENYDAVGAWRTKEAGLDVDATGELSGTRDIDGPFNGAIELSSKLARSTQVADCVATQVVAYALATPVADLDGCMVQPVADAFARAKYDVRELLVATAKSDAFRYRPAP